MTGDAAYESFTAFLHATTWQDVAHDLEAHLTDVERTMLNKARQEARR